MKRYLKTAILSFLFVLLWVFPVYAEEASDPEVIMPVGLETPPEDLLETDEYGIQPYSLPENYDETELFFELEGRIKNALLSGETYVDISDMNIDRNAYALYTLRYYSPYLSNGIDITCYYNMSNIYTRITIENPMSIEETSRYFLSIDQKVSEILQQVSDDMSAEQKALSIHDYFIYEYEYDYDNLLNGTLPDDSYRSGGLFLNETGVCQAYAYGYRYIMNRLGIECYVTSSDSMNHAWNIINIDGSYYHVDCTWDDPVYDRLGLVSHHNFLLSDTAIQQGDDNSAHTGWDLTNLICDNTMYDNAYWTDIDSKIISCGDNVYYIADNAVYTRNLSDGTISKLKDLGKWYVWGTSNQFWTSSYSGLFYHNGELYYNTATEIRKISLDGQNDTLVFTPDTTNGYIYGSRKHGGELQYVIKQSPSGTTEKISMPIPFTVQPTGIMLEKSEIQLNVNDSISIGYVLIPGEAVSQLTWNSEDPEVAIVSDGVVTAIAAGTTTVTVVTDNGVSASCMIEVEAPVPEPEKYTITYNLNGGSNHADNPSSYEVTTDTIILGNPTRTGYTFAGWYSDSNYTIKVTEITKGSTGNKTFYAKWTANQYTIRYDGNGATGGSMEDTVSCKYGTSYTLSANGYTKKGYKFAGWATSASGAVVYANQASVKNLTSTNGKVKVLYAKWALASYKITYNLNGGKNNSENPTAYKMTTATITLKNPTRTGYTFQGWYSDSAYKTKVTQIAKGSTGNKTLYAKWTANKYTIRYNKNGATGGSMADTTSCKYGTEYTLRANAFTRKGYTFTGWATSADGDVVYADKASVKNLTSKNGAVKTLYAKWKLTTYKITYNLNGGKNHSSNPSNYKITTATITLKNPTRTGYTFKGWYSDSAYKTKVTQIAKGSTGNKTLYAKWEANSYKIRYNKNGATGGTMADTSCIYGKSYTLRTNAFTKKGYTFAGWATSASGDVVYANKASVKNLSSTNGAVKTLYAKWKKNTYKITYNLNGGKNHSSNPATYTVTTATIMLKNPTRTGYTFKGWYSDSAYKTKVTQIAKGSTGNKTLYAKWVKNATYVYVTKTGACYHRETCSTIKNSASLTKLTKTDAENKGYKACSVCKP